MSTGRGSHRDPYPAATRTGWPCAARGIPTAVGPSEVLFELHRIAAALGQDCVAPGAAEWKEGIIMRPLIDDIEVTIRHQKAVQAGDH